MNVGESNQLAPLPSFSQRKQEVCLTYCDFLLKIHSRIMRGAFSYPFITKQDTDLNTTPDLASKNILVGNHSICTEELP